MVRHLKSVITYPEYLESKLYVDQCVMPEYTNILEKEGKRREKLPWEY